MAPPDCDGEFVIEHYRERGALAKPERQIYRIEKDERGRMRVRRWVKPA